MVTSHLLWDKSLLLYKVTCLQWNSDVFPPVALDDGPPSSLQLSNNRAVQWFLFYSVAHILQNSQLSFNRYKKETVTIFLLVVLKIYFGSKTMNPKLTWKNCSSFSKLQKNGCLRTRSAEGRLPGSTLNICSIRSLATMSPDKQQGLFAAGIWCLWFIRQAVTPSAILPSSVWTCTRHEETLQRQSSSSHRVCLFAAGRGCMFPARCWPVSAETSQKDDFPGRPRSKTHNRQRRCRRHRSTKINQKVQQKRWSIINV